ncbi:hypothetical protein SH139x_005500 [Planctomycetaceae bacterium SH139]
MNEDRFQECPQRKFRFVDANKPQLGERLEAIPQSLASNRVSFQLRPPLAVQVQELDASLSAQPAEVVMKVMAVESPVPETILVAAQAWLVDDQAAVKMIRNMQLQGCTILQSDARLVIFTLTEDRIVPLMEAMLEAFFLEREVGRLESELAANWSRWEDDIPLSFQFGERHLGARAQLLENHNAVRIFRSRLERLSSAIHAPHVYPPTYASQASERYRERAQLAHRHEVLSEQLQSFTELYDSCAQRTSDYMIARTGHQLEWAIIILLVIQVVFSTFDILTSLEASDATTPVMINQPMEADSP